MSITGSGGGALFYSITDANFPSNWSFSTVLTNGGVYEAAIGHHHYQEVNDYLSYAPFTSGAVWHLQAGDRFAIRGDHASNNIPDHTVDFVCVCDMFSSPLPENEGADETGA